MTNAQIQGEGSEKKERERNIGHQKFGIPLIDRYRL